MTRKAKWMAACGVFGAVSLVTLLVSTVSAKPPRPPCPNCAPSIGQNGLRCQLDGCGSDCVYTC